MAGENSNNPGSGTAPNLGAAAAQIAGLLSDDLEIGGTQENHETRPAPRGQGNPQRAAQGADEGDPNGDPENGQAGDGTDDEPTHFGDEGEGEPGEQDPDGSDDADGAHALSDDTPVPVQVGGKTENVTLGELRKGYLRQADYTRKTQEVATERQTLQRDQAETRAERDRLKTDLEQAGLLIQQYTPKEPTPAEWDALYAQNPTEWIRQRELWRSFKEQQSALAGRYQEVNQRAAQDRQKQLAETVQQEAVKLKEAIPEWSDPKVMKADRQALREYALGLGYTPEDVANTTDHRIFVVIRKAMKYDELMQRQRTLRPSAPTNSPKVVRPGTQATTPASPRRETTEARKRLAQTGNVRDAASLIEKML